MTALVAVDNLTVEYTTDRYTVRPLDRFTMHAPAGQLVALLGPSGSGKTTLLSLLSGMIPATSGQVVVNNIDVLALQGTALEDYRRKTIGIVFQGFNLIPSLTARENVAAPLLLAGGDRKAALARADALLEEVGLADRATHKPVHLSGGQQQRVAVARGLIGDPIVLLADEPTANLDHISAEAVVALLQRLRDRGRTIIISTHDDRLLPAMDQVVAMHPEHPIPETQAEEIELAAGQLLFKQSDPSDYIYEIVEGTVDIIREYADGSNVVIATRAAGSYVGELGPMLGFPRSATVRAQGPTRLRALTTEQFRSHRRATV
jgi:putative ABC transport system ATP-binding protein